MGSNLARNLASREGNTVAVYNRSFSRTEQLITEHPEAGFIASETIDDFVNSLATPRTAIIMVQAGAGTDAVISNWQNVLNLATSLLMEVTPYSPTPSAGKKKSQQPVFTLWVRESQAAKKVH
jgi:6-phosphogluconate dehydrogenase